MSKQETKILDCKPVVTYAGDAALFTGLESSLTEGLPRDPSEWRRSYGRSSKSVYIEARFEAFNEELLTKENDSKLIGTPIMHVYWTECVDTEIYKTNVREDLEAWFKTLAKHDVADWMVVIVETPDVRKANKLLPRTTVLDKIRAEFAAKHADRCISVIHPVRSESRSAESWKGLLARLRLLLLAAYNKALSKFGELVRAERERRNETGWSFCKYFLLQEEQAFVLEMLGLYDEALVQYDELDALFTQFVLNSNVGESPSWLTDFQRPIESWCGLLLSPTVDLVQRQKVGEGAASLLQFRAYLFTRQCALLLLMCKPWEIAQRCLPFLHNCLNELNILEVESPAGATACWVALACLEVLHTCERFHDSGQVEQYSLYTASLWAYARDKLRELGDLCGLMPGCEPTSAQLDTVVWLSAGMGDAPVSNTGNNTTVSPIDALKDALSSQSAFQKHYLELAELAMGTYKHIGRIRSARLIGRDLAAFYRRLGQAQKAAAFLGDALATFREEGWNLLEIQTLLELSDCFRDLGDKERLAKACACLAAAPTLSAEVREKHFEELTTALDSLPEDARLACCMNDSFEVVQTTLEHSDSLVRGSKIKVTVSVRSMLPGPVQVKPTVSLNKITGQNKGTTTNNTAQGFAAKLHMVEHLDFKQDKALGSASIVCSNPKQFLRRRDSQPKGRRPSNVVRGDFSMCLTCDPEFITLEPGPNTINLEGQAGEEGTYSIGQLSILLCGRLEFLSPSDEQTSNSNVNSPPRRRHSRMLPARPLSTSIYLSDPLPVTFCIESKACEVTLTNKYELLTRLPQKIHLDITAGSDPIIEGTEIKLRASRGLQLSDSDDSKMSRDVTLTLPSVESGQTTSVTLNSIATPPPNTARSSSMVEFKVIISGLSPDEHSVSIHYVLPMQAAVRLHTAYHSKFVQVCVSSMCSQRLILSSPNLECVAAGSATFKPLDCGRDELILGPNCPLSYMWTLELPPSEENATIKARFHITFRPMDSQDSGPYSCEFDLSDYRTLYVVTSHVEPAKGSEFCRAGALCHLQLTIQRTGPVQDENSALMYELLSDQSTWAVCGRTAGVVTLQEEDSQSVTLDVMPLTGGFLPHPLVRLSKYIPAEMRNSRDAGSSHPRLQPFSPGQVYNSSKAQQVHVLVSVTSALPDSSL